MDRERLRTVVALLSVLSLPILLLVAAPAVAQTPTPGKPKVDRLVMGLITPYLDYVRPWINGTADHNIQHDPMLEWLVEVDAYVHGFYPDLEGWDPTWEKRFPAMYGYDPAAAKRLLAEAGYPKGFKAKAWLYPFAGAPEMIAVIEAVALQLREVGIEIALEEADWVAAVRPKLQKREASGYLWAVPPRRRR